MADITQNPDYQLVMKFLQNIRPGDMDQESSDQLMMIGQRMQAGGALTDREREMFEAVVGATDRFPVEQMDSFPQGNTNPDIMKDPNMGAVSDAEMQMYKNNLPSNVMSMDDAIAAGLVNPMRPKARPAAPMASPRPMARPQNLGGR